MLTYVPTRRKLRVYNEYKLKWFMNINSYYIYLLITKQISYLLHISILQEPFKVLMKAGKVDLFRLNEKKNTVCVF
jgi:hypothetical protein